MKYFLLIALTLLTTLVNAQVQPPSAEQQKVLFESVDNLIQNYVNLSRFVLPGQSKVTDGAITKFKGLFTGDALIADALNPAFYDGDKINPDAVVVRKVDDYATRVKANYPRGFTVKLLNSDINFKEIANKKIQVLLVKKTAGFRTTDLNLQSIDTVVLNLSINKDYNSVLISKIDILGRTLNILNDKEPEFAAAIQSANQKRINDALAIRQAEEKRKNDSITKVKIAEQQRLDSINREVIVRARINKLTQLIQSPAKWWIGLSLNAGFFNSSLTETNRLGYEKYNTLLPNQVNPAASFSGGNHLGFEIQLQHFFGKKAEIGVGFGLSYATLTGTISKSAYHAEFQANEKSIAGHQGNEIFRQHITATTPISEELSMNNITLPITVIYRKNLSSKLMMNLEAGLLYSLSFTSTASSNGALFDYEAIYQYNTDVRFKPGTTFDQGLTPDDNSWLITKANAQKNLSSSSQPANFNYSVAQYFQRMSEIGYNVGLNQASRSETNTANFQSGAIGFLIRPSILYKVNENFAIKVGAFYQMLSISNTAANYKLIDENYVYNTMMNGVEKASASSFGLNIGIVHSLFYNKKKWEAEQQRLKNRKP